MSYVIALNPEEGYRHVDGSWSFDKSQVKIWPTGSVDCGDLDTSGTFDLIEFTTEQIGKLFPNAVLPEPSIYDITQDHVEAKIRRRLVTPVGLQFFSAPTGLGKTTGFRKALQKILDEPDNAALRVLVMVPTREDVEEHAREMEELCPDQVGVWTQAHDPSDITSDDRVSDPRFSLTKRQASEKQILYVTHNAGRHAEGWVGERDLVIIDEYPDPIDAQVLALSDFHEAYEHEVRASNPDASTFANAANWAQWCHDNSKQKDASGWLAELARSTPMTPAGSELHRFANRLYAGTGFLRRSGELTSWISYDYDVPFSDKAIVFSATAATEGWHYDVANRGALVQDGPSVDYSNVTARFVPWPSDCNQNAKHLVQSKKQMDSFLAYVAAQVPSAGEETLFVCPKAIESYVADAYPRALTLNWGRGAGSNKFRDCTRVVCLNLYHLPAEVHAAHRIGHSRTDLTPEMIHSVSNNNSKAIIEAKHSQIMTQLNQMIARGACRKVNDDGTTAKMDVICLWPQQRYYDALPEIFPGIVLSPVEKPKPSKPRKGSIRVKVSDHLKKTKRDVVTFSDLNNAGIRTKGRMAEFSKMQEVWGAIGWTFIGGTSKTNPSRFERT